MELHFSTISYRLMRIDVQPFHRNTNATTTYFVFPGVDSIIAIVLRPYSNPVSALNITKAW